MGFDFNPVVGSWGGTLDKRKERVESRDPKWVYQRYAYFKLIGIARNDAHTALKDYQTVFELQKNTDVMTISQITDDTHLELYSYTDDANVRKFKPILTSATITAQGGGDIYDAYISEVNVDFTVYTQAHLNKVQKNFFILGGKAKIKYGWVGEGDANLSGESEMTIYNFGFTMNTDGSYNCNVKGLTGSPFMGNQPIASTIQLTDEEELAQQEGLDGDASVSQALLAKAFHAFGTEAKVEATRTNVETTGTSALFLSGPNEPPKPVLKKPPEEFFLGVIKSTENNKDDVISTMYITLEHFIRFVEHYSKKSGVDDTFNFLTNKCNIKAPGSLIITTPIPPGPGGPGIPAGTVITMSTRTYGSADPRKYIFPGPDLSYYGDFKGLEPHKNKKVKAMSVKIQNILISVHTIDYFYNQLSGKRKDEKPVPVKTIDLIRKLSSDINRLSGGLADIQVVVDTDDENKFLIFNNTEVQKDVTSNSPYKFNVLSEQNIVKDVSITSDFDVDTMLMMNMGRVRNGEFNLDPLAKLYDFDGVTTSNIRTSGTVSDLNHTKQQIGFFGINDGKATSLAVWMRQKLTESSSESIFKTLPFYLKLSVTLDGIDGIGFLQPVTVDRLPDNYKWSTNNGVRFLITGIEHKFDGQGGWDTTLDTAMKLG